MYIHAQKYTGPIWNVCFGYDGISERVTDFRYGFFSPPLELRYPLTLEGGA